MATKTPASPPAEQWAGTQSDSWAGNNSALKVKSGREAWTYTAHPGRLICMFGEVVPRLSKAFWTPGSNGNAKGAGNNGVGWVTKAVSQGGVVIPHRVDAWRKPPVAFRKKRDQPPSVYWTRYDAFIGESPVVYHQDAWHRPDGFGDLSSWEHDAAGWLAFLVQIREEFLAPKGLGTRQIAVACDPIVREIRKVSDMEGRKHQRRLRQLLAHLPEKHAPRDVLEIAASLTQEAATAAP